MPIYEYRCRQCNETFEVFQKIHDEPVTRCKFCQGNVDKLISHTSFQLKGSGWYLTDYSRKSQPSDSNASPKETGGKTSESKGGDSGSAATSTPSATPTKSSD